MINPRASLVTVLAGFVVLWLLLDRSATWFGSFRGEAGLAVCALVLVAAVAWEIAITRQGPVRALTSLGLQRPPLTILVATLVLSIALLCFFPLYAVATGASLALVDGWPWLLLGMFAQGGIAEETVFRGFLFRHFRQGRTFWRAAALSAIPFTAVHLPLFASLDFVVALASVLVAVSLSLPFAWLFERAGTSILPPALLHTVVQASIKLVETDATSFQGMAIGWMALSATTPWLVFLIRPKGSG